MPPEATRQTYTLLDGRGRPYTSPTPGRFGGHRRQRLYGRLDCPAARKAIAAGGYVANRVFFADEQTAESAGYRPCAVCLPAAYKKWKAARCQGARRTCCRKPEAPMAFTAPNPGGNYPSPLCDNNVPPWWAPLIPP